MLIPVSLTRLFTYLEKAPRGLSLRIKRKGKNAIFDNGDDSGHWATSDKRGAEGDAEPVPTSVRKTERNTASGAEWVVPTEL